MVLNSTAKEPIHSQTRAFQSLAAVQQTSPSSEIEISLSRLAQSTSPCCIASFFPSALQNAVGELFLKQERTNKPTENFNVQLIQILNLGKVR